MNSNWVLVFDKATGGDRAKEINLSQIVKNYNPQVSPAPVTIGHTSSYPKDTRVPAGAWTTELREEGNQKLYAKYDYPENVSVTVPPEFKQLAEMPKFLKEAVNSGMYKKRSIGVVERDGEHHLHHIAYLGGTLPECKGMPDHKFFTEHPEFEKLGAEFNDGDTSILEFEETMPDPKKAPKPEEFAAFDPSKLEDTEIEAIGKLLEMLREDYSLDEEASPLKILGAMEAEEGEAEEVDEALQALGILAITPGTQISNFDEKANAKLLKKSAMLRAMFSVVTKIKEFDNAAPAPGAAAGAAGAAPPAAGAAPATEVQIATLGKTQEQCTEDANKAKETLDAAGNWLPSWDEKMLPLMSTLANVKTDAGSALDTLVSALNDISGIAEMQEYSEIIDFAETIKERKELGKEQPFTARKGQAVGNLGLRKKVKEFQAKNKDLSYSQAYDKLIELGELTDADVE